MDQDEVDRWLDAGDVGGPPTAGGGAAEDPWGDGPPEGPRRWRRIAAVGAGVWLVLAVVLVAGRGEGPAEAGAASELSGVVTSLEGSGLDGADLDGADLDGADPDDADPDDAGLEGAGGDQAGGGDEAGAGAAAAASAASTAAPPDGTQVGGPPPAVVAGAVRALRSHMTTAGPPATYLEWATLTGARALDAGIWLVALEAIWLAGEGEALDTAHVGTWAVALADDGQPLAAPWPLATRPPATAVPAIEPPTGTERLPEVQQGLTANGWADVTAVAADPHPLLPDVVVALVEGTPPTGGPPGAAVVWLLEQPHGGLAPLAVTP